MKNVYALSAICLLALLVLNLPKAEQYMEGDAVTECSCFGVSTQRSTLERTCYGIPYGCSSHVNRPTEVSCTPSSCKTVMRYLGVSNRSGGEDLSQPRGMDILLVIDSSLSMKGEKIDEAKDAAIDFIRNMAPQDKAGIISFDSDALLVHSLSGDRDSLVRSIEDIEVAANTYYIPPLRMGLEVLSSNATNRKIMIFLSDGDPLDDKEEITSLVRKMRRQRIDMYTVWIGEGGSQDNFLRELAREYDAELDKNYVSGDIKSISRSFREIYTRVRAKDYLFNVERRFPKDVYKADESIPIDLNLYSRENRRVIPGYHSGEDGIFCADSARITVILQNGEYHEESLNFSSGSYTGLLEDITPGNYTLAANISVSYGAENCSFSDYQDIGALTVLTETTDPCDPIPAGMITSSENRTLFQESSFEGYRQKSLVLAIDHSESMGGGHLAMLKEHIDYLTGLLTKEFKVSLISFSDDATILSDFTTDAEVLTRRFQDVRLSGSTKLTPMLEEAERLFVSEGNGRYILIISDGVAWDEGGVLRKIDDLVSDGICIETLSYGAGSSDPDRHLLKEVGYRSRRSLGCGTHRYGFSSELRDAFRRVYYDLSGDEQDLFIDVWLNNPSMGARVVFIMRSLRDSYYSGRRIPPSVTCAPQLRLT